MAYYNIAQRHEEALLAVYLLSSLESNDEESFKPIALASALTDQIQLNLTSSSTIYRLRASHGSLYRRRTQLKSANENRVQSVRSLRTMQSTGYIQRQFDCIKVKCALACHCCFDAIAHLGEKWLHDQAPI